MAEDVTPSVPGGEGEATAQGTPPVAEAPIGRAESVEETYARLGLTFTEVDDEGNEAAPDASVDDESTDDDGEADDSVDDDSADGQEEAGEAAAATDWVSVIRDAPQRINEVPAKERSAVIEQIRRGDSEEFERRLSTAIRQEREQAVRDIEARRELEAAIDEIDEMRENDPAAFKEWEERYPDRASAYYQFKATKTAPRTQQAADPAAAFRDAAAAVLAPVVANETVMEELRKNPGRYTPDAKGLAALTEDVNRLLAAQSQTAQRRQSAIEPRKRVPKADATPGANPKGVPDIKNMTKEEIAKLSPEQVAEALAIR